MRKELAALGLATTAIMTLATPATAQQQEPRPADAKGSEAAAEGGLQNGDGSGEDIIVTAQKREQRLIEVPQSISVVSGDALEQRQATSFADYVGLVPGLSIQQGNPGNTRVVLRGINTGSASPTVAIYVDDTPFGSSTSQTNGAGLAGDFDTFDIERVEVLRGPQGTLYGANSLGGVIKYVTVAPALGEFEARGQAGVAGVSDGGTDWSGNGVVNVPLGSSLALRASGFYRRSAGFIDAIGRPAKDVNRADSYGGRASLLFKPSDNFSIRLTALAQNIRADSRATFDADPVTLEPISSDPVTGRRVNGLVRTQNFPDRNNIDYRVYTGALNWDFGFAGLTSVTSYSDLRQSENTDVSYPDVGGLTLGDLITSLYGSAVRLGVTQPSNIRQKKFTQEVRLTSANSDTFEWLIGGYYTREPGKIFQQYFPFESASGRLLPEAATQTATGFPTLVTAQLDSVYKEYAGFGSATVHVTSRFDVTGGARYSHNKQTNRQVLDGALFGGLTELQGKSSEGVFTWSVSPRLELNDRTAVYARVAKGYRPGGPNVVPPGAPADYPFQFKADTLLSYEAGIRAETADRSFGIDASIYYLDWKKIQIVASFQSAAGPINADANGKGAESYGAEVTATLRPTRGLSVVGSVAYNHAKLTDDTGNGGFKNDQLPYAPRWNANLSADYEWSIGAAAKAFVGADLRLVSDRPGDFDAGYQAAFGRRLILDGFDTVDVRAGVNFGKVDLTVFGRNLANARGLTTANTFGARPAGAIDLSPIRPRTIGATLGFRY